MIQKFHWSPSQIDEFLLSERATKSFYYASILTRIEDEKKQADKLKK